MASSVDKLFWEIDFIGRQDDCDLRPRVYATGHQRLIVWLRSTNAERVLPAVDRRVTVSVLVPNVAMVKETTALKMKRQVDMAAVDEWSKKGFEAAIFSTTGTARRDVVLQRTGSGRDRGTLAGFNPPAFRLWRGPHREPLSPLRAWLSMLSVAVPTVFRTLLCRHYNIECIVYSLLHLLAP